jgi:hypothetical protein
MVDLSYIKKFSVLSDTRSSLPDGSTTCVSMAKVEVHMHAVCVLEIKGLQIWYS